MPSIDEDEEKSSSNVKTIEEWGTAKGSLPATFPMQKLAGQPAKRARPNPEHWKFAAAKALRKWPEGKEVTEEEFDKAVAEAAGVSAR